MSIFDHYLADFRFDLQNINFSENYAKYIARSVYRKNKKFHHRNAKKLIN
jgi:hypothetical protein